jgi:glycosyltransferase involved in cell wall biosynthesis
MGFASLYLNKHRLFKPFIDKEPERGTNLIVVIPCFNEPGLISSLDSLHQAERPSFPVEVIVVVNAPEGATDSQLALNRQTLADVDSWSRHNHTENFTVHVLDVPPFPSAHAGAGTARKTGMDEAVHRFNISGNDRGIIASFDADSVCDSNYLTELEKCFSFPGRTGCTVYFEHPISGEEQPADVYPAITLYELYLRYFVEAMRTTRFPWAFHTVGSCFAVNAKVYAMQGGMNRKAAGEDFYFLHKIFPLGNFTELNSTRIIPSSRVSDRAPFGTGATIGRFAAGLQSELNTWPVESFDDLSVLFELAPGFFRAGSREMNDIEARLPLSVRSFLREAGFPAAVELMNRHSASLPAFVKRFYLWFNAFRIIKFLNYTKNHFRADQPVTVVTGMLLERAGISPAAEDADMLMQFRELQRRKVWNC